MVQTMDFDSIVILTMIRYAGSTPALAANVYDYAQLCTQTSSEAPAL